MTATSLTSPASRPLEGVALLLARAVWLVLVALQLVSFVPLLPDYLSLAAHPCPQNCLLTSQDAQSLTRAGIAPTAFVGSLLVVTVLSVLVAATLAGIIFVRRSHDRMALITAYFVVILPTSLLINHGPAITRSTQATAFLLPPMLELALEGLQTVTIYGMFLLFPSGRFVPRWSWALLIAFVAFTQVFPDPSVWPALQVLGWLFFFGSAVGCIGYRYRRVSTLAERQQTKWVLFGFVAFVLTSQLYWLPTFTPLGKSVYAPLAYLVYQIFLPLVPITFFIAIQRYRLYDIDTIINRTLIYGSLTLILAAVYAVCVVGMQAIAQGISGRAIGESPPVIVVTTLVSAALFQPARRRIRDVIDQRFYRRKYDAAKTLQAFSATLRNEMDLDALREQLLTVVQETMQPTQVSLWLRQSQKHERYGSTAHGDVQPTVLSKEHG